MRGVGSLWKGPNLIYSNILETECSVRGLGVILITDHGHVISFTFFAVLFPSLWAPTPAATPATVPSASAARALPLSGWWPNERKVYVNGLLEHLGVVGVVDGGASLLKGSVFNQGVTLLVLTSISLL